MCALGVLNQRTERTLAKFLLIDDDFCVSIDDFFCLTIFEVFLLKVTDKMTGLSSTAHDQKYWYC